MESIHTLLLALHLLLCLCPCWCEDQGLKCGDLQIGQFTCKDPVIDPHTQSAVGCTKNRKVKVLCMPVENITCSGKLYNGLAVSKEIDKEVDCRYTTKYSYTTTLLLSIFLGMFGVDRMYLGYPAIGLLKFCTMGFLFVGQFLDIILIATQVVKPADGSDYIISYYGPMLYKMELNNQTYIMPPLTASYVDEL
ncbi:TM2 domain-containing protein CG10795-like [Anneissia japonica]|uniref:TM2 domain-containing protein CG10795-like n=1 Tax=Anneissia japonica TaxID=1529436 RepID=UPI001425893F|nr:TM2 domain-containing protein CG10795-like [Anneissia japonica]XP_033109248.1 TM2 domain-containing protein CG10795-like [Anneissia japonica]